MGHVDQASALAEQAARGARETGTTRSPATFEMLVAQAQAALGRARTAEAAELVEQVFDVVDVLDFPYARAHAAALLVEVHAQEVGWAATAGSMDDLCERAGWVPTWPFSGVLDPLRIRALAASGRADEAARLAVNLPAGRRRTVAEATALLAARRFEEVVSRLENRAGWPIRDEVEALVLLALANTGTAAEVALAEALRLAAPVGLRSPFLQRGETLERVLARVPAEATAFLATALRPAGPNGRRRDVVEPLTRRERELLALLPTHLSYAGMAERMYLSVNTVKTNLKATYRKLGTRSRDETVSVARQLGLLPAEQRADA
jgi:DNA-binding CsgD family transcriptional regulator